MASTMEDNNNNPGDSSSPTELTFLTLNCWGLLHLSQLRRQRIHEIGRTLSSTSSTTSPSTPDIVGLQELFCLEDFDTLHRATAHILPHAKFYHSGPFGAGLAVLSRFPIVASSMVPYRLNGRPTAFWRGDWYVGKGIACATLKIGDGDGDGKGEELLEVFNTHTHAPYEEAKGDNDSYYCQRLSQSWQMGKLVRAAIQRGRLVAALGDFNMLPLSPFHRIITAQSGGLLRDVWRVLHPDSALGPHLASSGTAPEDVPSAETNLRIHGATSNNVTNTWRWTKSEQDKLKAGNPCPIDPSTPDPPGQRLDYIFVSTGQPPLHRHQDQSSQLSGWVVKSASVTMTERHPELHVSLSDHFAVQATVTRHTTNATATASSSSSDADYDAQLLYPHTQAHKDSLTKKDFATILASISRYITREKSQQYWRGIHFYASLAVWVACLVAVWFSPRNFVSFILILVASLGLTSGVVDGLIALLFFSTELGALNEFEWEILNAAPASTEVDPARSERGEDEKE